jgi:hypothetical protein
MLISPCKEETRIRGFNIITAFKRRVICSQYQIVIKGDAIHGKEKLQLV